MSPSERKQEVIDVCLKTFMANGLSHTSTKNLCDALHLNSGGVFFYFKTKEDIVIACAEEATKRIENELFGTALANIENPDNLVKALDEKAVSMRPLMQFFISVCVSRRYGDKLKDVKLRQGDRYRFYIDKIAKKLGCNYDDVAPLFYTVSNTMFSYMIYDPDNFSAPQLRIVYDALVDFLKERDSKDVLNKR